MKITIKTLTCFRCNWTWKPRVLDVRLCPKCGSAKWDVPKEKKEGQNDAK